MSNNPDSLINQKQYSAIGSVSDRLRTFVRNELKGRCQKMKSQINDGISELSSEESQDNS